MMKRVPALILVLFAIFLSTETLVAETYQLSMLPRYSSEEINRRISPLAGYLSKKAGVTIEPIIINNFTQYEKRLKNGVIEIGYENPYIYVLVSQTHEVLAMALKGKGGDKFRGIIIVRSGSDIVSVNDLKNRRISIVGRTSAGGYLSQKLTLMQNGLDVEKDCQVSEAIDNKQENVILSVYTGDVDAGFIRESALHMADKFVPPSMIKVINRSAWLPNWALSVKRSLPEEKKKAIKKALTDLKKDNPVIKALKIINFRAATDEEYDPVRQASGMTIPERN